MKKHYYITKKLSCFLLTAAMVFGSINIQSSSVLAEENTVTTLGFGQKGESTDLSTSENILELDKSAGYVDAENPYGYAKNVAFNLSVGNELLFYGGYNGNKNTSSLNGGSINDINNYIKSPTNKGGGYSTPGGTWNWVQAVAFDNDKENAKDDKVLFVGLKGEDKCAYAWVLDYKNNKITDPTKLGSMDWIGDDYEQFSSTSLFDVAAGDFDGDGVDTLLVYTPQTFTKKSNTGCVLYELSYNGSSLTVKGNVNNMLMSEYINNQNKGNYYDSSKTKNTRRDKLAVSMQVGDFNGDKIDDLAVLSYSHDRNSKANTAYYSPQLTICYGKEGRSSLVGISPDEKYTVAKISNNTITFPVGASLVAGDLNGDGCDDLCVVGVEATAKTGSDIDLSIDSNDYWYVQKFNSKYSTKTKTYSIEDSGYQRLDSNAWFKSGFYEENYDHCYGKTMAASVAISGKASQEMLFIAGSLYNLSSSGDFTHVMTGDYFKTSDKGAEHAIITNTFIQSVAVGNFDNNAAGREQVVFVVGLKQKSQDDYFYRAGVLTGTNFADTKYSDGSTCYGTAKGYECTMTSYIYDDKGDDLDEGLNCLFIPLDYDDDSVEIKYMGARYVYTDPVVIAVLQAAPYFDGITDSGYTTYSITTSYASSDTLGYDANVSIGIKTTGGLPFTLSASAEIGIKGGVNRTFTDSRTVSYQKTFKALSQNLVFVKRTREIVYFFDVKKKDSSGNMNWTGATQMEMSVPDGEYNFSLTVDEYNDFVDDYNTIIEKQNSSCNKLYKIDKEKYNLSDNEGNPYGYSMNGWSDKDINDTLVTMGSTNLGDGSGSVGIGVTEEYASNESTTFNVGLYANFSLLYGPQDVAAAGIGVAGDVAAIIGLSTTTVKSEGSSFEVMNLNKKALLEKGIPEEVASFYNFDWTAGIFKVDLGMKDEDGNAIKTPFLEYSLSNVSRPPMEVTDLKAESISDSEIKLSWSKPDYPEGWPEIDNYILYLVTTGSDGSTSYCIYKDIELSANDNSVIIKELPNDDKLEPNTEYSFAIRSCHELGNDYSYSLYSNCASVTTPQQKYDITFEGEEEDTIQNLNINVKKSDGTLVESGDKVEEDSIIQITCNPKDVNEYKLEKLEISCGDEVSTVEPDENGEISTYYHITGEVNLKFYTKRIISQSKLSFYTNVYDTDNNKIGTVEASYGNISINSGATITEPVTIKAIPEEGYILTSWVVTVDGVTKRYQTNDKTTITLGLLGDEINVLAEFDLKENIYKTITINQPSEGGYIALYNENNEELIADENGNYVVSYDTKVRFVAVKNTGYVITSWTGDATGQTEDSFTMSVVEDITVGIEYKAPVKYNLTYTMVDENNNTVTVNPYVRSGSTVAAGTELTFAAFANEGYRIEKWIVTQGQETTEYIMDDDCCTMDSKTIYANADTVVEVSFVKREEFKINVESTGKGNISIVKGNTHLKAGDLVEYMSNVLLIVKPDSGWKLSNTEGWDITLDGSYVRLIKNILSHQNISVAFEEIKSDSSDNTDDKKDDTNTGNTDNKKDDTNAGSTDNKKDDTNAGSTDNKKDDTNAGSTDNRKDNTNATISNTSVKTGDSYTTLPIILFVGSVVVVILVFVMAGKNKKD